MKIFFYRLDEIERISKKMHLRMEKRGRNATSESEVQSKLRWYGCRAVPCVAGSFVLKARNGLTIRDSRPPG